MQKSSLFFYYGWALVRVIKSAQDPTLPDQVASMSYKLELYRKTTSNAQLCVVLNMPSNSHLSVGAYKVGS